MTVLTAIPLQHTPHKKLLKKTPKNLSNLFNKFNDFSPQQNKDTEGIISKYYNIDELQSFNDPNHDPFTHVFFRKILKILKISIIKQN